MTLAYIIKYDTKIQKVAFILKFFYLFSHSSIHPQSGLVAYIPPTLRDEWALRSANVNFFPFFKN